MLIESFFENYLRGWQGRGCGRPIVWLSGPRSGSRSLEAPCLKRIGNQQSSTDESSAIETTYTMLTQQSH